MQTGPQVGALLGVERVAQAYNRVVFVVRGIHAFERSLLYVLNLGKVI